MSSDNPKHRASTGPSRNPATRQAIIAATQQILAEKGYGGISFEEIARRAGAGKPTIYRWWPTKADLFIEVYGTDKEQEVQVPNSGDLQKDLTSYTLALWNYWRTQPAAGAFKGLIAEAQSNQAALDALVHKFLPQRTQAIRQILLRGVQRGDFPAADLEARVLMWIGFSWYHLLTGNIDAQQRSLNAAMAILAR